MIEKLKQLGDGIVIAGDGRHDSMGHSAKCCAYTIFCCTSPMIIHFDIIQVSRPYTFTKLLVYEVGVLTCLSNPNLEFKNYTDRNENEVFKIMVYFKFGHNDYVRYLLSAALSAGGSISIYLCELCIILKLFLRLIIFTWSFI